jgi:hypothetical protein
METNEIRVTYFGCRFDEELDFLYHDEDEYQKGIALFKATDITVSAVWNDQRVGVEPELMVGSDEAEHCVELMAIPIVHRDGTLAKFKWFIGHGID